MIGGYGVQWQPRPELMTDTPCSQSDPEIWFPNKGESAAPAKRVCASCPVQIECRDWALKHGEVHGIWGGMSVRDRRVAWRKLARS